MGEASRARLTPECKKRIKDAVGAIPDIVSFFCENVIDIYTESEMHAVRKFLQYELGFSLKGKWAWYKTYKNPVITSPHSYLRILLEHDRVARRVTSSSWLWGAESLVTPVRAEVMPFNFVDD